MFLTREQLNKTSRPVTSVCLMDHTQRISDLLAEINAFQVSAVFTDKLIFHVSPFPFHYFVCRGMRRSCRRKSAG